MPKFTVTYHLTGSTVEHEMESEDLAAAYDKALAQVGLSEDETTGLHKISESNSTVLGIRGAAVNAVVVKAKIVYSTTVYEPGPRR